MAGAKQLQAVQGFLRGIRALSTYEVTRERQFAQLEKGLGKLSGLTAAQAGALLGSVEEALWSYVDGCGFWHWLRPWQTRRTAGGS